MYSSDVEPEFKTHTDSAGISTSGLFFPLSVPWNSGVAHICSLM